MKTNFLNLKQTIDEVSLRYPYSITGTPKNLFAWGVGRIGKQSQESEGKSQKAGFKTQKSGFRAGLLRRVAAVVFCLLTVGVGEMWADWYLRGVNGNWDASAANMMTAGTNNIVWMSHATNSGYVTFKITNGTGYTTQYGQNSGNAVFGAPYLMKKDGSNAYTDNWSSGTYYYYFNTLTLYLTVYNTIEVKGDLMSSGWDNTTSMTFQSDGSWKQVCTATLTASTGYEFKIHANDTWTGYSSSVTCKNGTATGTYRSNIKVTPTHGGNAVVVFHPEAGGTINVYCPYQVSYAAGTGASGSVSASAVTTYGSTCTLSSSTFSRTGYTQDGWSTTDGGTKAYDLRATYTGGYTDVTLYPHWVANSYSITYKDQGGGTFSGTQSSAPTTHTYGTATALVSPTKTGYLFGGWFTNSGCTGTAVTSLGATGYTADITLYAKWTAITVTSVSFSPSASGTTESHSFTMTFTTNVPTDNTYQYAIREFAASGSSYGAGYQIGATNISTATITTETMTPGMMSSTGTYKTQIVILKGGSVVYSSSDYTYTVANASDPEWSMYNDATKLGDFTNNGDNTYTLIITIPTSGYSLLHYNNDQGFVGATGAETLTTTRTLKNNNGRIAWQDGAGRFRITISKNGSDWNIIAAKVFTVTYNGNSSTSGTVPTDATYYTSGSTVTVKGNTGSLVRTGHTFGGWNENTSGTGTNYTAGTGTFSITADKTLYAKWTANTYTISYYDQGGGTFSGTQSSAPTTHTYGTATTLKIPTKTGYTFGGWYTSSDCSTGAVGTASSASLGATAYTANINLYAKWTETKYAVTVAVDNAAHAAGNIDCSAAGWVASKNGTAQIGNVTEVTITVPAGATGYTYTGGSWALTGGVTLVSGYSLTNASIKVKATAAGSATFTYAEDLTQRTWVIKGGSAFGGTAWSTEHALTKKTGHSTESVVYHTFSIAATNTGDTNADYKFKVVKTGSSDEWYGLTASGDQYYLLRSESGTEKTLSTSGANIELRADIAGDYVFKLDYSTPASPKVTVTFPPSLTIAASAESVYADGSTTLTVSSGDLPSGSKSITYEFFKGTTLTDANKVATQTFSSITGTSHTATGQSVSPEFTGTTISQVYTVRMTVNGTAYTKTITIYRKWDIYVQNNCNWANGVALYMYGNGTNATWPGVQGTGTGCEVYSGKWYKVTLDGKYTNFILDNNVENATGSKGNWTQYIEQTNDLSTSLSTYPADSYWSFTYSSTYDDGGKKYYYLTKQTLSAPTVYMDTGDGQTYMVNTNQIFATAHIDNYGGDGSAVTDMLEVGFKIGDTEYPMTCMGGDNNKYFWGYITGLTAGTSYTVKAYAKNIVGTGTSSNSKSVTTRATGTTTIKVRIPKNNNAPYIYAWTGESTCNGTVQQNAADPGVAMTAATTGTVYKWYTYSLSNEYNKFLVTEQTNPNNYKTDNFDNPFEETCYWYDRSKDNTDGNKRMGSMICPTLAQQLMIDDGNNGSFTFEDMTLSSGTASKSMTLTGGKTYRFKVIYQGEYFSKALTALDCATREVAALNASDEANLTLRVDFTGTYTFYFDTSTKRLYITFPDINKLMFYDGEGNITNSYDFDAPVSNVYSKTVTGMTANTTYQFMVVYNCNFYCFKTGDPAARANNASNPVTAYDCDNWRMYENESGTTNCYIETTIAGDYTFSFDASTTDTELTVQYPRNVILSCDNNSWAQSATNMTQVSGSSTKYYYDITLTADDDEEFKVIYNSAWYGGAEEGQYITYDEKDTEIALTANGANYHLAVAKGGSYRFTFDTADKTVKVTYPTLTAIPTPTLTDGTNWVKTTTSGTTKIGSGTEASPYLLFAGKDVVETIALSLPSNTGNIYFKFDKNGTEQEEKGPWSSASSSDKKLQFTESTAGDDVKYVSVKAYYKFNNVAITSGSAESAKIYYKVVPTPTVALSGLPQENGGNAAYILEPFSITTTSANVSLSGTSVPTYEYKYTRVGDATERQARAANTTIPETLEMKTCTPDYYTFTVEMRYGGSTFTSAGVSINLYDTYSVLIYDPHGWFSHVYAWGGGETCNAVWPGVAKDNCCTEVISSIEVNGTAYTVYNFTFKHPMWTHIQINQNANNKKTSDIEITSNTCVYLSNNNDWNYTKSDNCSIDFYRIQSKRGSDYFYSNVVQNIGDTMSYYAATTTDGGALEVQKLVNGAWRKQSAPTSPTSSNVYYAVLAGTPEYTYINSQTVYTGSFYVRTDGETGTWNDYKDGSKTMTKFENKKDLYPNEYYNHYWCQYLNSSSTWTDINIKAQVANDYNQCLSVTLPDYILPKQSNSSVNWGTNVRFAYDNTTNLFEVKRLQAAQLDNFLQITGYSSGGDNTKNYAYKTSTINEANHMTVDHPVTMSDLSDWMYQADFYINAPGNGNDTSSISIQANYYASGTDGSVSKLYLGGEDETKSSPFIVMGKTTSAGLYLVRVIYDYKTNRLIAAWLPYDSALPDGVLDANMMIIRTDDAKAKTVGIPSSNASLTSVHKIYGILEINKDAYLTRKSSGNMFYWISLPFDVKVKDIFGIDGFKSKWFIQRYRGDLRAQNGYYEGQTFWRNMNANETATLEAGRGYVVYLNLDAGDFKEVSYIDTDETTKTKSIKRLFFPSDNTDDFTLTYNGSTTLTSTFPENICNIAGRRNQDSNWYVAGVKGYNTAHITNPANLPSGSAALDSASTPMRFFYEYTWGSSNRKDNYTPTAVTDYDFRPFEAYMFQYAGSVTWDPKDISTNKSMPGRREIIAKTEDKEILIQINLDDEQGNIDRTFVSLSTEENVTEEFDLNIDLTKIINSGSQIYSIVGDDQLAGNVVPYDIESVPLGVKIADEGTYTFNLEDVTGDKTVYLYDKQLNQRTCLTYSDYDITLDAGTYNGRFFLEFAHAPSITTDIENESGAVITLNTTQYNGTLYIEGLDNKSDISLYDMTGRLITSTQYNTAIGLDTPPTGIYLLSTGTQTYKIVVK